MLLELTLSLEKNASWRWSLTRSDDRSWVQDIRLEDPQADLSFLVHPDSPKEGALLVERINRFLPDGSVKDALIEHADCAEPFSLSLQTPDELSGLPWGALKLGDSSLGSGFSLFSNDKTEATEPSFLRQALVLMPTHKPDSRR